MYPRTSITTCGPALRRLWPSRPIKVRLNRDRCTTIGTGCGAPATAILGNQGIHEMDICRWGLGVDTQAQGVISYGGRFGYEDAGETPNTDVIILDYGPKTLVFEVRGLNTPALKTAKVGVIFEGTDGYIVLTDYSRGARFDKEGKVVETITGGGDHHANFIKAVRSRNRDDLNAEIEKGHLSTSLVHMGNISYRLGEKLSNAELIERLKYVKMSDSARIRSIELSSTWPPTT